MSVVNETQKQEFIVKNKATGNKHKDKQKLCSKGNKKGA